MFSKLTRGSVIALAIGMGTAATAQETLSMWARTDVENFLPQVVAAFNATHETQINVQFIPPGELVQKFATAAAGGSAPDILSLDLIYTPAFAAAGQLADLTDLAQALPYFDHLSPAHLQAGSYDGRIYGLPFSADSSVLLWNKDLYAQAGLDPEVGPTDWDKILEQATAVRALGGDIYGYYFSGACAGCNAFTFLPYIWAQGSDIVSEDGTKANIDTPEARAAVELYRSLLAADAIPQGAETDTGTNFFSAFASGNIGIATSGAFAIGILNSQYGEMNYGVTYIPGPDGTPSSFGGGDNFVVTAGTENMEAVGQFIDHIYSVEMQTLMAEFGSLPVRGDVAEQALTGLDARYGVATDAMAQGRTPSTVVYNDIYNSATGPWLQFLQEAIYGDDVDEAAAIAQETIQMILDEAN
ncbi:MAG: sugar ABC transporter substrate-binding protein [Rubellimicrobium sp.]|nr:sugar ABC transporter substrate-binding protein [Rubellimicrobium sp.]